MAVIKLTRTMRKILNALAEGDKRPIDLKEKLNLADSTLHITLRKLEEMGLVEKKVSDKKYAVYGLTEKGKEYVGVPKVKKEDSARKEGPVMTFYYGGSVAIPFSSPSSFGFGIGVGSAEEQEKRTEPKDIPEAIAGQVEFPKNLIIMLAKMVYDMAKSQIQADIDAKGLGIRVEEIEEILLKFATAVLGLYNRILIEAKKKALEEEIRKENELIRKVILEVFMKGV